MPAVKSSIPSFSAGPFVVAGEHDDFRAEFAQSGDRGGGAFLDRIGDGDETQKRAVVGGEDHAFPLCLQLSGAIGKGVDAGDVVLGEEVRLADQHHFAVDLALGSGAGAGADSCNDPLTSGRNDRA